MRFREMVRRASLSVGLYRQAKLLDRHLNQAAMDAYLSDKKHYSQLLPRDGVLCFDVGANVGKITSVLLELGNRVVAFEPQADCVEEIKAISGPYKRGLRIEETALGDSPGEASLYLYRARGYSSLNSSWKGSAAGAIKVKVSTLDLEIEKYGVPHYCKIDVEGWELNVLRGLSQAIPLLSFEYHQTDGRMQKAYACLDHLRSLGEIEVNLTANEQSLLVLDEWVDADAFRDGFLKRFLGNEQFSYGDLYVRML